MSGLFMQRNSRIFVAGHKGLLGSAIVRELETAGYFNLLLRSRQELDLLNPAAVASLFDKERPEFVFLAAAKVGGILANGNYPAEFIHDNLVIQTNIIESSRQAAVRRLLFLGSSCIYPKMAPQPMPESCLLSGPLEPTNRPYAIAKIAGIEMCSAYNRQYSTHFLAAMPTNLYGPGDNFDLATSHVLPALMRKTADAIKTGGNTVTVWGSGNPRRELLYSADAAEACLLLMNLDEATFQTLLGQEYPLVNIGTGKDVTIRELAEIVSRVLGFKGALVFDGSKPDGTPQKLMDVSKLHGLGWRPRFALEHGIARTWELVRERLMQ
jgi:GDP-L-fucose synthase